MDRDRRITVRLDFSKTLTVLDRGFAGDEHITSKILPDIELRFKGFNIHQLGDFRRWLEGDGGDKLTLLPIHARPYHQVVYQNTSTIMPLQTYHHASSVKGLSSITTLIVGASESILIDPPFLIPDALSVVGWIKETTSNPLKAVFVTHHHPDHFFSANPILDAFPSAKFYAAPYVLEGINREYDDKVKYWPTVFGHENVPEAPKKPEEFNFSFFLLNGNPESPVVLLGPLQGDSVDHTIFWLPTEKTVVCGDTIYGRSTHVWVEEVETPALLEAWNKTIALISALEPAKVIPGHLEPGWELDAKADIAHTQKYLHLFAEKVTYAQTKPQVQDLFDFFKDAFPQCQQNLDFFLGHLSNQFGEGGKVWEENRHHDVGKRTIEGLTGYWFK
ncbi:MBL fold metallo-hydrolase [Aspergillus thermomutatus]|uniref:Metallo-beta-lactamase domain-containing protein n=1 Tax=Aspergillus thermomutatus TaxID=41047 RepID=A0A397HDH9_ASPTH|nr:uncharacterized protein CDV56_108572 [Aspergillus thermomutatus]RHZ58410.1 hypothetical protein CDV56_108572 [Aspergillus thermomutatus]